MRGLHYSRFTRNDLLRHFELIPGPGMDTSVQEEDIQGEAACVLGSWLALNPALKEARTIVQRKTGMAERGSAGGEGCTLSSPGW
jgi:hypothetical protein